MYAEIRNAANEMENLQGDFVTNDTIFKQSKNYVEELQKNIREVSGENERLK